MRRSTRRRAFYAAPMPSARPEQFTKGADNDPGFDVVALNRAATCAYHGRSVAAEDAWALVMCSERLADIATALSHIVGELLDGIESGHSLTPDGIAYYRQMTIIPTGPLFEVSLDG